MLDRSLQAYWEVVRVYNRAEPANRSKVLAGFVMGNALSLPSAIVRAKLMKFVNQERQKTTEAVAQ